MFFNWLVTLPTAALPIFFIPFAAAFLGLRAISLMPFPAALVLSRNFFALFEMLAAVFLALLLVFCVHTVMAGAGTEVRSGLSGDVTWVVSPGTEVSEGAELVRISTLTGESAAARSPQNGTVTEVMVHPGEKIATGTVVARVAAK